MRGVFEHARFCAPHIEDGKPGAAVIEDKNGRRAIKAGYFIDATGDGDVEDWDLSGGVFVCGDVENLRGRVPVPPEKRFLINFFGSGMVPHRKRTL